MSWRIRENETMMLCSIQKVHEARDHVTQGYACLAARPPMIGCLPCGLPKSYSSIHERRPRRPRTLERHPLTTHPPPPIAIASSIPPSVAGNSHVDRYHLHGRITHPPVCHHNASAPNCRDNPSHSSRIRIRQPHPRLRLRLHYAPLSPPTVAPYNHPSQ
jgi:hypothetical protein